MTTYEKIQELCKRNGFEISNLSNFIPNLKASKSSISKWKNGAVPRADTLKRIADYFRVDINYFNDDKSVSMAELFTSNTPIEVQPEISFSKMSEAQRAMVKRHMRDLLIEKYQTETFELSFCKDLGINSLQDVLSWFKKLNNRILDSKIPDMLSLLSRSEIDFFSDMNIVIKYPSTAIQLNLELEGKPCFPIIVSGTMFFPLISKLSLASLSVLDETIPKQIATIEALNSAETLETIMSAAKSGIAYINSDDNNDEPTSI